MVFSEDFFRGVLFLCCFLGAGEELVQGWIKKSILVVKLWQIRYCYAMKKVHDRRKVRDYMKMLDRTGRADIILTDRQTDGQTDRQDNFILFSAWKNNRTYKAHHCGIGTCRFGVLFCVNGGVAVWLPITIPFRAILRNVLSMQTNTTNLKGRCFQIWNIGKTGYYALFSLSLWYLGFCP